MAKVPNRLPDVVRVVCSYLFRDSLGEVDLSVDVVGARCNRVINLLLYANHGGSRRGQAFGVLVLVGR